MSKITELEEGVIHIVDEGASETWIKAFGGGGILMKMDGHYREAQFEVQLPFFREVVQKHGVLHMFVDSWQFKTYETPFRSRWTAYFAEVAKQGKMGGVHMLVRSPVVRMGVGVANMLLKGFEIETYSERGTFEAAIRKKFPAFVFPPAMSGVKARSA